MKRASAFIRLFAFLIDLGFLFFVSVLLFISGFAGYLLGKPWPYRADLLSRLSSFFPIFLLFSFLLFLFYFTYLSAHGESTIGKSIFDIRVVCRRDGENIGFTRSLIRTLLYWVSAFPFFLGFLMAFLLKGRALHDMLTGTMVVKEG